MPSDTRTPASRAGKMGVSRLQQTLAAGYARAAVAKRVAAAKPFRRPEGTPNCLPLPPYVERDPVAEAAAAASMGARLAVLFANAVIEKGPAPKIPAGHDRIYDGAGLVYSRYAESLYKSGWLTFPQRTSGNRGPEGGIEYSEWRKQYPPLKEIRMLASEFPFSNVAVMLGEVSHWSIAFDVDVMDQLVCNRIQALMVEHLGPIRMQRWGQAPKFIALYRTAPDVEVRAQSYALNMPLDDYGKQPALEVLGHKSVFTGFGFHHCTGGVFKWAPCSPYLSDPRDLTLVTREQINGFLHAVHREFPFMRAPRSGSQGCSHDPDDGQEYAACELAGAYIPLLPLDGGQWANDGTEIVDGRYMWMRRHSLALVCGNPELIRAKQMVALADAAWPYVSATLSDRGGDVRQRYLDLVKSTARKFLAGNLTEWRLARRADGTAAKLARHVATARGALDEALSWLGRQHPVGDGPAKLRGAQREATIRSTPVGDNSPEACARRAAERSLLLDRASVHAIVVGRVVSARDAFIKALEANGTQVIVSGGPTGAGKTTTTLSAELVTYLRENPRFLDGVDRGPVVVAVATHANMDEAAAASARAGILLHDSEDAPAPAMDAAVADAEAMDIKAVGWKGKGKANCQRWQEMAMLNEAGISTSGLCRQRIPQEIREHDGTKAEFEDCRYWKLGVCKYQKMKEAAAKADIVFVSHYWLTAGVLPTELQQARALVVDESILFRVAQAAVLPVKAFGIRRAPPRMDSQERKEFDDRPTASGYRWDDEQDREELRAWGQRWLDDRDAAAEVAKRAMRAGQDVATAFAGMEGGKQLLDAAVRVCTDGMRQRQAVYPSMSLPDVQRRCQTPMPEFIRLERRFWIIVRDRAAAILADRAIRQRNLDLQRIWARVRPDGAHEDLRPTPTLDAQGNPGRDMRLQRLLQPAEGGGTIEGVRVSWRAALNWANVPTLLLDASADEAIIARLFPGRAVEMHRPAEGDVHLNIRTVLVADGTYSTSAMAPATIKNDPEADRKRKGLADARLAGVGKLLDLAAATHGNGRVLLGASKKVREMMHKHLRPWRNVDEVHYGAQRGLDFAKGHLAAVSVGRSEMPIWLIDGLVAALTWDAPEPEEPYDKRGDGTVDGVKPLMRVPRMRVVHMRDGRDVELVVPVMPGPMAAAVDRQWREEEISQFRGRLRPVFRDSPATWVHVSSVIPEGVVADELLTLDEATSPWSPVLATVPGMLGVVSPVETARLASVPVAEVEAYVAAHADDPSWRILSWTDTETTHVGLMAAWVTDLAVALGMAGVSVDADRVTIGDLRAPMVPSGTRAPDAVELARPTGTTLAAAERGFAAHWLANGDGDREAARVGWVRERLDAPPPEPEVPAEPEPDDEPPATDDVGWADDGAPEWPASWLDTSWSPDALAG